MVLKAQVRTSELHSHEQRKGFPPPLTSKSQVKTCGISFRKIKIFVSMVLKAQVQTCELRGHKRKKKDFRNHLNIEVTDPDLWHQFRKNQNFCLYGSKITDTDL